MERSLTFTKEHEMFRATFRKFVENELVPNYAQWEKERITPRSIWKRMGELGFLCPWVEEKYGGVGTGWANGTPDITWDLIMMEELGWKSVLGLFSHLHNLMTSPYIDTYGNDEQRARWLPGLVNGDLICAIAMTEPGTGSDLGAVRTKAVREGDYYLINGSKTFISNGVLSDLVILVCKTDPQAGYRGLSLIVVERGTPGFERSKPIPKIGFHCQDTATLYFEDCRVPVDNLLGQEGDGWGQLMSKLQPERLCACQISTCMAERALELAVQYAKERQIFGKLLSRFQNTQFVLAECAAKAQIARTFTDTMAVNYMKGQDITQEVSMGKQWICEMANEVASKCLQIFGGYGFCAEYEISRIYDDSRVMSILAGSSEVMKLIVSRGIGLS
ncbi:MAG: acyl-CoA dehydrogenase [Syntrophomonadaceae bacterium]|jgi:acyl-CoA dehydrogenase|nr:acyl-CoA dehydrogenase [Syntrophomonadaceae bacterium]